MARRVCKMQPNAVIFLVTAFRLNELPANASLIDAYFNKPLDLHEIHQAPEKVPGWNKSGRKFEVSGRHPRNR